MIGFVRRILGWASASEGGLGRDTLIYGIGVAVSRAASVIMLPIYTRFLTPSDYGILELLQITTDVLGIVLAQGVAAAIFRYYFKSASSSERDAVISSGLGLSVSGKVIGAGIAIVLAPWLARILLDDPAHVGLIYIAAVGFMLSDFTQIPMLVMQIEKRPVAFASTSVLRLVVQLTLNIVFVVYLREGPRGVLVSTLITNVVFGAILAGLMIRRLDVSFDWGILRRLFDYGLPLRIGAVGTFLFTFSDRLFLKAAEDLHAVGLYALAYKFGFVLTTLAARPFLNAWSPRQFELAHEHPPDHDRIYNRSFRAFSTLVVPVAVVIALYVRPLLEVMSDEAFHGAARIVPLLMLAQIFLVWALVADFGIQMSEQTRFNTYSAWTGTAIALSLYALLIPRLGAMGAALATATGALARLLAHYHFAQKVWPIAYDWRPHLRMLVYGAVLVGINEVVAADTLLMQTASATAGCALYGLLLWFAAGLEAEDKTLIRTKLAHWRRRLGEA